MALIEFENIHKYYNKGTPSQVHALRGVDLTIASGEMVAIVGKSGSGKSTLLHILGCLDTASEGCYRLDDQDISRCDAKALSAIRNKKIGFVLQEFGLILHKSAYENVSYPLVFNPQIKSGQMAEKIRQAIELVGLSEKRSSVVNELSGGQKQRIAIARALVNNPEVILADEPTGALDSETSLEIMALMKQLNAQGKTIVLVTHDHTVADFCQRKLVLSDGMLVDA